jgi:hypothetical protein
MNPRSWSARSALISGLVHLYLGYQINPDALASFALENLFNKRYSRYLDVEPWPRAEFDAASVLERPPTCIVVGLCQARLSREAAGMTGGVSTANQEHNDVHRHESFSREERIGRGL